MPRLRGLRAVRRHRLAPRRHTAAGVSPGTIQVRAESQAPTVTVCTYSAQGVEETVGDVGIVTAPREDCVTWVHVRGLGDEKTIQRIAKVFDLHALAIEDVLSETQRTKIETYDDRVFCVLRTANLRDQLQTDQLSLFWGKTFVVTFEDRARDSLGPLRERLHKPQSTIRSSGADYLAYCVIDAVIDDFYPVIETLGDRLEELEDYVLMVPTASSLAWIHSLRADLLILRRTIWPLHEVVDQLLSDSELFLMSRSTRPYLRDCYDHVFHLIDVHETCRDASSSLMEAYNSAVSVRSGDVMKVLTVIATIFIPLTFISGLYGMNFSTARSPLNMPELNWYWGYPFALGLMLATAIGLLVYFWRKGWFGAQSKHESASAPPWVDSRQP
jgi:magnesium transporter